MNDNPETQLPVYQPQRTLPLGLRLFLKAMRSSPLIGEAITPDVTRLLSSYSAVFITPVGNNKYILFDAGFDRKATEIHRYLDAHSATADDVIAVFLTHGHSDHMAGLAQFPQAKVYVGASDKDFVEGTVKSDGFLPSLAGKLKHSAVGNPELIQPVQDDETITMGEQRINCFAVPGHTRGSMAYLIDGVLIVGDALTFDSSGQVIAPPAPLSYSVKTAADSLKRLVDRLDSRGVMPSNIVPSHSGGGTLDAIRAFVAKSTD